MGKVANHLHRYKKTNIGSKQKPYWVYRCMRPACSHYIPMSQAEGKLCECNRCEEPMIITRDTLTASNGTPLAKPHCPSCTKSRKAQDVAAIAQFLEKGNSE